MTPELILTGGVIRTMDPARPVAQALAIGGGRFLAVGGEADVAALAGRGTRTVRLHGRAVLPGLIDAHTHGLWGAVRTLCEVWAGLGAPLDALLAAVAARAADMPPGRWIVGAPWHAHDRPTFGPRPAALIDALVPDRPVALKDTSMHALWLNTAGLRACGIGAATPDPAGGTIERDDCGNPTGILKESAMALALPHFAPGPDRMLAAARHMAGYFHSLGLTGFKEPMTTEADLAALAAADAEGALNLHVACCLARRSPFGDPIPHDRMAALRDAFGLGHLHPRFAKLFLDGVVPARTAAFVEPYAGDDPATHDPAAMLLIQTDALAAEVTALDALGFTVKMHAVGDRAAQAGLDAIAAARAANGPSGLRHEIAHCTFVRDADLPRFAALGAVAEVSPRLWFPNPVTPAQRAVLGAERAARCHRIGSLLAHGAEVVYGSDWPASAEDADPWPGLAGMITRRDPTGRHPGALGPDEAIPLDAALPLFTTAGARALGLEGRTGILRPGASADLIVLPADPGTLPPEALAATRPLATLFEGRTVHGAL